MRQDIPVSYDRDYLDSVDPLPISLTLPLQERPFHTTIFFPCFDGLIPEGWLLSIASETWKINQHDRMGLLLACCRETIGAVSIRQARKGSV